MKIGGGEEKNETKKKKNEIYIFIHLPTDLEKRNYKSELLSFTLTPYLPEDILKAKG